MATILSTDSSLSTVKKVYSRYSEVKEIYFGKQLAWKDDDALPVYDIEENVIFFYDINKFVPKSSEISPLSKDSYTSEDTFSSDWSMGKEIHYGEKDLYVEGGWSGRKKYVRDGSRIIDSPAYLTVNGVTQEIIKSEAATGTNYYKYVIPENQSSYGKIYTVALNCVKGSREMKEYQTSDSHALFGLENDYLVSPSIDYGASAKDWLTRSSDLYTVSSSAVSGLKVLVFRPLQECQINFGDTNGFYCSFDSVSTGASLMQNLLNSTGSTITTLPSSSSDLNSETYPEDIFKPLTNTLQFAPGTAVLVGFFAENTFDFSEKFEVTPRSINLNGLANSSGSVTITTADSTTWTVATSASWLKLGKTSGSGNGYISISATSVNETGVVRTANVNVTTATGKVYVIYVRQDVYVAPALDFGDVAQPWTVTKTPNVNIWNVEDNGNMPNESTSFIPFKVSKPGTISLSHLGSTSISSCDPYTLGAAISTSETVFDSSNALPICSDGGTETYSVTPGTYYLQVKKSTSESISFNFELSFN